MQHQLLLLILLFIAHYIGDFSHLSRSWMLAAKRIGSPLFPIFCHALVHAVLMGVICNLYLDLSLFNMQFDKGDILFLIQLGSHFGIDVLKGKMNVWFPKVTNPVGYPHWYLFGADQLLHQVVIVIMWYIAIS